jgi:DNA (cytosine-5)-methyltransferase 1
LSHWQDENLLGLQFAGGWLVKTVSQKLGGLRFVDLFAGLGGFHVALSNLGHRCVFASEIDPVLRSLYAKNFGVDPSGDIRKVSPADIPKHDILCSGSPCQPFSKAGDQEGLDCPKWGDLFDYVLEVLRYHEPKYIIFENVPNLTRHNSGKTWAAIEASLRNSGYEIDKHFLSPHQFGVPQIRERVFIVGSRKGLQRFEWPKPLVSPELSIAKILDHEPPNARKLSPQVLKCLAVWQRFIELFPKSEELPSFPIWSMEFGATYPYEEQTPHATSMTQMETYRGSHGLSLKGLSSEQIQTALPSYARVAEDSFPRWKVMFIRQNREFYQRHRSWIDPWLPEILEFPPSLQKLEWNCKGEARDVWKYVIQFRASGVRIKRPTTAPSLVAMTTTQVPIIGWERRYMTPRECARLQSLGSLKHLPEVSTRAFKALGNAVNADVVQRVAGALIGVDKTLRGIRRSPLETSLARRKRAASR